MSKKKAFGERAQASAPFELFVAVIIMGFVMLVGSMVLLQVNTQVCLDSVDKEMTTFKISLEDTVAKKESKSFSFRPQEECFSSKETVMKIELEKDKRVCAARCGYPTDECYVMTFSNLRIPNAFRQKCIDLPSYTSFMSEESCFDTSGELTSNGYSTINPTMESMGGIKKGLYVIRNVSPAGDTFPKICVWYKAS